MQASSGSEEHGDEHRVLTPDSSQSSTQDEMRDRRLMSGVLFHTHLTLFNQVSTLTGAAKRYVSVVGTGKILIRTLCPDKDVVQRDRYGAIVTCEGQKIPHYWPVESEQRVGGDW